MLWGREGQQGIMNADSLSSVLTPCSDGVRLAVKARPGQGRARDMRIVDIGDGRSALEVTVCATPEDGKANRAILKHLADALGVKASVMAVVSGATGRLKVIEVAGDAEVLRARLMDALGHCSP